MLGKKALVLWAQKLIYIFLIIWVGGLAPLIYFENYSSHRDVQRVQVSLLTAPGSGYLPVALRQQWAQRAEKWPSGELNTQPQWVTQNISLPGINSSVTIFHDGYLFTPVHIARFIDTSPAGSVSAIQLMGRSVWLLPPEKPPPFPIVSCQV
jgi:hypothetical protein